MSTMGFAVRVGDGTGRLDPNYHAMNRVVATYLSTPLFPLSRIADVTQVLQYGCSRRATYDTSGTPILRMSNMQKEGWLLDDVKFVDLTPDELALWRLQVGDLVVNRTNSKELVGKCEVFDRDGIWVFASYLMRLRVDTARVLPSFLRDFLSGGAGRSQIDRDSRQIAGMSNINRDELKGILFPCPDLKTQDRLVASMDKARTARNDRLSRATALLQGLGRYVLEQIALPIPPARAATVWAARIGDGATLRLDPQFHHPRYRGLEEALRVAGAVPLGKLCVFSRARTDPSQGPGQNFGIVPFVVELREWRTPCFRTEVVYSTPRQQPHRRAGPARPRRRPGSAGRGSPAPAGSAAPPPPARSPPSVESSARRATA